MNPDSVLTWSSCAVTHKGNVRQINEDAFLEHTDLKLWAVADGMGGHDAGDLASKTVIEALARVRPTDRLSDIVDDMENQLHLANTELRNVAKQQGEDSTIGSTVVAMLAFHQHCIVMWAGDSRAYMRRNGTLIQLSSDHSQVGELVKQGLLLPQDADSHPASNIITRAIGATDELFLDIDAEGAQAGDTFLLCSDGLYQHVTPDELNTFLELDDIQECSRQLLTLTLERGAKDNLTLVVIRAKSSGDDLTISENPATPEVEQPTLIS